MAKGYVESLESALGKKIKMTMEGRSAKAAYKSGSLPAGQTQRIEKTAAGTDARRNILNQVGDVRTYNFTDKQKKNYFATGKVPLTPSAQRINRKLRSGTASDNTQSAIYAGKGTSDRKLTSTRARRAMNRKGTF